MSTIALSGGPIYSYSPSNERWGKFDGIVISEGRIVSLRPEDAGTADTRAPRTRHFIEHFELATPDQITRAARLGIYLSMQPQFDELWGHPGGMYDARLGAPRARTMNALGSAKRAGATQVGGDDSPVCRLSPLAGMRAATNHHNPAERLDVEDALLMYTYDAARFGHAESQTGRLAPGYGADFVVLEGDPIASGSFAGVRVAETWSEGMRVAVA